MFKKGAMNITASNPLSQAYHHADFLSTKDFDKLGMTQKYAIMGLLALMLTNSRIYESI